MSDYIIETDNLTVYYGQHRGIVDVNLTVEQGEIFGFLGPNGAGKTTTQRVLLDIIRPTQGRAMIFGQDCQQEGVTIRKRVGYLPGELSLYPDMRGRDFLQMLASLHETDVDTTYRRRLYEMLDLDPKYREPILLQVIVGLSCDEIADELGITRSAVMTQLFRAREKIKARLKDDDASSAS